MLPKEWGRLNNILRSKRRFAPHRVPLTPLRSPSALPLSPNEPMDTAEETSHKNDDKEAFPVEAIVRFLLLYFFKLVSRKIVSPLTSHDTPNETNIMVSRTNTILYCSTICGLTLSLIITRAINAINISIPHTL